jgi:hypothetical protein
LRADVFAGLVGPCGPTRANDPVLSAVLNDPGMARPPLSPFVLPGSVANLVANVHVSFPDLRVVSANSDISGPRPAEKGEQPKQESSMRLRRKPTDAQKKFAQAAS